MFHIGGRDTDTSVYRENPNHRVPDIDEVEELYNCESKENIMNGIHNESVGFQFDVSLVAVQLDETNIEFGPFRAGAVPVDPFSTIFYYFCFL